MAAEVVGGAFLSASLQVLFERLASPEVTDFIRRRKAVDRLLKDLKIKLLSANSVLNDAEERQIRNPAAKEWLDELKEAIYDAEDLMAEIKARAVESKLGGESSSRTSASQVLKLVPISAFSASDTALRSKLSEILDRLDFILKQKDVLGLKEGVLYTHSLRLSAGLAEESVIYGRDVDKNAIVKLLLADNVSGSRISVISIVGMGGIGKTSLAQLVYDDDRVDEHFEVKAWVTVSDKFDVFRVTRTIFETITSSPCEIRDLHQLQVKLKNALKGKKFLLVLDDVWNENYVHWDVLRSPLESGAPGSWIIVTTRSEIVASKMSNVPAYYLQMISDEACWLLFAAHAFNGIELNEHSTLEAIGRQIVRKCGGLPLAVKSLGGLLRSVVDPEEWMKILKSGIWELSERDSNILPALWLSYHYLPSHLKRCFAYCSIFPKGYKITKEKLILLWMAEDLLQPNRNRRLEDVGNDYFLDLLSRSLFQQADGSRLFFKMHDLVNELAKFISGDFSSRLDNNSPINVRKTRHLSYMKRNVNSIKKFEALFDAKHLRTFIPLGWKKETESFPWNDLLLHKLLPKLPCLRVLSLSEYPVTGLPDSLGNLKNLRYLDLSWTGVKELPCTICALFNLETLILSHCRYLTQLPSNMGDLINLRYLDIECTKIKVMPQEMCKMKLQALSNFVVGENSGSSVKQLRELKQLRGYLCISGLENVVDIEDVTVANLKDKKFIKRLHLRWDWHTHTEDSHKERMILDRLQPHKSLKELFILCYRGTRFPDWVGQCMFSSMAVVSLSNCKNCCLLPPLGQLPSLRKLDIRGFESVVKIGAEFFSDASSVNKPFRCLEILRFGDMPEWKEWSFIETEEGAPFPRLKELYLRDCPKLIHSLPDSLPNLTTLNVCGCQQLTISLQRDHLMDTAFPSLRSMEISNCLEFELFLQSGSQLPSNLSELSIVNCEMLFTKRVQWNLQRLASLTCLRIRSLYHDVLDFFPEENLLPATLVVFSVSNLPNLRVLNTKGFQQLSSLKQLWISSCGELQCLPDELPVSLTYLFISECPLLNQRCQREKGQDWPKISHISRVRIDGELI